MPSPSPSTDHALRDRLVVVFGGGGFLGSHLAQGLLNAGARLRLVSRHIERAYAVKALGNLGQVQFTRGDITDVARLPALVHGAAAVVNLVGAFSGDLDAVQGAGAGALAAAAGAAGARSFVHVSAIGADAASPTAYGRSKAAGEAAVLAAFPQATVIRPSVLFGADDHFITMFASLCALPVLPVFAPEALLAPLWIDDAAAAIVAALDAGEARGKTYEIAGPEAITMLALNQRIAAAVGRRPLFVPLPDAVAALIAALPGTPISRDQLRLLQAGNVPSGRLPGLAELGVTAHPLGLFLDRWLVGYRKQGRFGARVTA